MIEGLPCPCTWSPPGVPYRLFQFLYQGGVRHHVLALPPVPACGVCSCGDNFCAGSGFSPIMDPDRRAFLPGRSERGLHHRWAPVDAMHLQPGADQPTARPAAIYDGALNTVGLSIGISAGSAIGWAVFAPTTGVPAGALAGEYVGVTGTAAVGVGGGANVLMGGSNRTIALQPVSLQGSVALNVVAGVSSLTLRWR